MSARCGSNNPSRLRRPELYDLPHATRIFEKLKKLLQDEGNQTSQDLIEGTDPDSPHLSLEPCWRYYESNRQRALLMKSQFERKYLEAQRAGIEAPKYSSSLAYITCIGGFNPLNSLEIGNHVAELAEGRGTKSVHIMIIAARGSPLAF